MGAIQVAFLLPQHPRLSCCRLHGRRCSIRSDQCLALPADCDESIFASSWVYFCWEQVSSHSSKRLGDELRRKWPAVVS